MGERILTLRELNRATLARQLLLERASITPLAAIRQVAGLQGQLANPPYIGLWSRLQAFQRADLTRLLERREVVRASMMRRTLHLTTTEDYVNFRPALVILHARQLERFFWSAPRQRSHKRASAGRDAGLSA
ncbi:DNA glycosylase AlkZ-like family protein [Ktedonobacter robiniae]|uniref:DNA glycosylase AlkZ-like family protein n=1 Tax=Ktedonobacter robiniae TaxID=2778365 RepID=UPI0022A6D11E|nr:crosslink repair DNA glycosylase YcaQ family protein [Ktedonobacter robiniae]